MIIKVKNWYFVKTLYEYGDVHVMISSIFVTLHEKPRSLPDILF